MTRLEEKKVELKKQRSELQTNLEQIEKLIKDLVRVRAGFFVSNELVSEFGEGEESEFDLASMLNSPEQQEQIEQLFQISVKRTKLKVNFWGINQGSYWIKKTTSTTNCSNRNYYQR